MADREPTVSRDSGRAIETSGGGDSSRWLAPVRESTSLVRQSPRSESATPYVAQPINWPSWGMGPIGGSSGTTSTDVAVPGWESDSGYPLFDTMADLFLQAFGADNPRSTETQYSVVPQEVGGSGGNSLLMLLILAGAGFAIYWFYFRKKGANVA